MTLPADVEIRPATAEDAEALAHLHLDCWDAAYVDLMSAELLAARRSDVPARVATWRDILAQDRTLVAELNGTPVGFASAGPGRDEARPGLEVYALYVRAAHWGTGVGHALLAAALGEQSAYLCVLEGNDRAVRFYERQDFRLDGSAVAVEHGVHIGMVRP